MCIVNLVITVEYNQNFYAYYFYIHIMSSHYVCMHAIFALNFEGLNFRELQKRATFAIIFSLLPNIFTKIKSNF